MVQNKIGGCKGEFEANEYSKWLGLVWVWWDVAENLLNLKSNNPTDTFGISKRTRGTWRGMQEGNLNKKGHKTFFLCPASMPCFFEWRNYTTAEKDVKAM